MSSRQRRSFSCYRVLVHIVLDLKTIRDIELLFELSSERHRRAWFWNLGRPKLESVDSLANLNYSSVHVLSAFFESLANASKKRLEPAAVNITSVFFVRF